MKAIKGVQKMSSGIFKKSYPQNVFTNHIYLIFVYEEDLALNDLQWFICHKTKQNKTKINILTIITIL